VHYNGCRLARWHARLGFCSSAVHPLSGFQPPLRSVHANGGLVPCLTLCVTRMYPPLFRAEGGGGGGGGGEKGTGDNTHLSTCAHAQTSNECV
jgi:hypothetical protein